MLSHSRDQHKHACCVNLTYIFRITSLFEHSIGNWGEPGSLLRSERCHLIYCTERKFRFPEPNQGTSLTFPELD